jgi:hypothetical protein
LESRLELAYDPRERRTRAAPLQAASRGRLWALGLALGVVALGLADCARLTIAQKTAPRDADWQAAAAVVHAGFSPGDLVVAAPGWADPLVRLHFGDLVPLRVAARADSETFARVWEVSLHGAYAPETAPPASCATVLSGRVRVRRCERPAARLVYAFVDHLTDARVALVRNGQETGCAWQHGDQRFACPGGVRVGVIIGEIAYTPHRCILAPPSATPGDVVRLEWPAAPTGRALVGYAGIHSFYARKAAAGRVDLGLRIGERERDTTHVVASNEAGWQRFQIATADRGPRAAVRLDIAAARPEERRLCFALEARE